MHVIQRILNDGVAHMLNQRRYSVNESGSCVYRGAGGKCFIGGLISDDEYSVSLEGNSAYDEKIIKALQASGYPELDQDEHGNIISILQKSLHDSIATSQILHGSFTFDPEYYLRKVKSVMDGDDFNFSSFMRPEGPHINYRKMLQYPPELKKMLQEQEKS